MSDIRRYAYDLDEDGSPLMNCMTVIAGRRASASGRVLVGHNEDDGGHVLVRHTYVPPMDWREGDCLPAEPGLAQIPQVPHTQGYYWVEFRTQERGLSNADLFLNDSGVMIVSNSMGASREEREDQSQLKDGGLAFNLRRALAERAASARDGVRLLMDLVDEWGYAPSGRAYTLADKDEAFMFQLVHGRHYMGARVPDDCIAVMPNFYNFHSLTDCPEMFYPADIVDYAIKRGWYVPLREGDTSDFDFSRAYQAPEEYLGLRNVLRQKHGQRIALARNWNVEDEGLPFCVKAERALDIEIMKNIFSTHYEGTSDAWEVGGPGRSPHYTPTIRNICTGTTLECVIADLRQDPEETILYTAFGRPCQLPLVPLHPLLGLPAALSSGMDPAEQMRTHFLAQPGILGSSDSAWNRFRRAETILEMEYSENIPLCREELHSLLVSAIRQAGEVSAKAHEMLSGENDENGIEKIRQEVSEMAAQADEKFLLDALRRMEQLAAQRARVENPATVYLSVGHDSVPGNSPAGQAGDENVVRAESSSGPRLTLVFSLEDLPAEESLITGLTHTDTRKKYATAIPGSLRRLGEDRYQADFRLLPFSEYLAYPGTYDMALGGRTKDGKPFGGLYEAEFLFPETE